MHVPAVAPAGERAAEPDSPQQRATIGVARELLARTPGERIPNVTDLRAALGVGAGTVQKVLHDLQQRGVVELVSKQRQGTVLKARDLAALWAAAERRPLTLLLPLPTSWEFQGLATGLRAELDLAGIPSTFLFGHGAAERARAVEAGTADVAVMSGFAAKDAGARHLKTAAMLPSGTYYAPGSVVVLARSAQSELPISPRIGIDRGSADHAALTLREFPSANLVEVSYAHIPSALTRGLIDAAVWHRTATGMSIADRALQYWPAQVDDSGLPGLGRAVLLTPAEDLAVVAVIDAIDLSGVAVRQADVVAGRTLPSY